MKKNRKSMVVQEHHIRYANEAGGEWKVNVYKGEHWILSILQWRRRFSKGFMDALQNFINEHKKQAVELHKEVKK